MVTKFIKKLGVFLAVTMLINVLCYSNYAYAADFELAFGLLDDGTYCIIGYTGTVPAELILPEKHNDKPVTAIDEGAFAYCNSVETVYTAEIKNIYDGAFYRCESLISVDMPYVEYIGTSAFKETSLSQVNASRIVTIGNEAFSHCKLTEFFIPATATEIGLNPFTGSDGLTEFNVDEGNPLYSAADGMLLGNEGTAIYSYPSARGDVIIPDYITGCAPYAFAWNENITSVYAKNVDNIEFGCFLNCYDIDDNGNFYGLESIDMPSLEYLGEGALAFCPALKTAYLPKVETVGYMAFMWAHSLERVELNSVKSIDLNAFWDCPLLSTLILSADTEHIDSNAFGGCVALENIVIPVENKYYTAENGKLLNKDKSVLFMYQSAKGDVVIDDGIKEIGTGAFVYCNGLRSINTNDVEIINSYAFSEAGLKSADMPNVKKLCEHAFSGVYALLEVFAPQVTQIDERAFESCRNLKEADFPQVEEIGANAFFYCLSLEEINLPKAEKIGENAFSWCSSLEEINLPKAEKIGSGAFRCSGLKEINLPKAEEIGEWAFSRCEKLSEVTLGNIKKLGGLVFSDCNKSIDIYFCCDAPSVAACEYEDEYGEIVVETGLGSGLDDLTVFYPAKASGYDTEMWQSYNLQAFNFEIADCNQDGTINTADATSVLRTCVDMTTFDARQNIAADVNVDGSVNTADAVCILKIVAGM